MGNMQQVTSVRDVFTANLPYKDLVKLRKKVILNPTPITELSPAEILCDKCDGTGLCKGCKGKGDRPHYCDCDLCQVESEECPDCVGDGKCMTCGGSGMLKEARERVITMRP